MSTIDQLSDIERYDYCHTDPAAEGDLITVRVTLDVVVSRDAWDLDNGTGTDPQIVRDGVQRRVRQIIADGDDATDLMGSVRSVTSRPCAGVQVAKYFDRGRRR